MHKKNIDNGWILCESKTFPGKLYYFNVVTGEAVWRLNELETKSCKKVSNIPKTFFKFHNCPEPNSPPVENYETFNTDTFHKHRRIFNSSVNPWISQSPIFTQAPNSNYILQPTPYIPNIMWATAPLATQMFMPNGTEIRKQMSNQITQTLELKERTLVQATGISLSERFLSYYNTHKETYNFKDSNKTSVDDNYNDIDNIFCCTNDKMFITSQSKHNFPITTEMPSKVKAQQLKTTDFNKISPNWSETICFKHNSENVASDKIRTEMEINSVNLAVHNETKTLDSSDLRLTLLAKNSSNLNIQQTSNKQIKGDRGNGTGDANQVKTALRKQASFNLSQDDNSRENNGLTYSIREVKLNTVFTNQTARRDLVDIRTMKNLRKNQMATEVWFVIADLNVLLNDFQFIESFVRQDDSCCLAIPYAVITIIKELATLNQNGSKPILSPRSILRRLMDSPRHIALLESMGNGDVSISKQILDSCFKLLERNYHVVLITTDIELFETGKAVNLYCYMLQQIGDKDLFTPYNKDLSSSQNDDLNSNDYRLEHDTLFMQKPNEFQPFVVDNKPEKTKGVQNSKRDNVINFKKVIGNDLCDEAKYPQPTLYVNDIYNRNKRTIIDSKNSGTIKVHRIIESEDGLNNKRDMPTAESSKKNVTKQFYRKDITCTEIDSNHMISNDGLHVNYNFINGPNYKNGVSCEETNVCKENGVENIVPCRREFKPNIKKYHTSTESIFDFETSKETTEKNLSVKLKKFYVKNKVMSERIKTRGEEWMCCFTQFMENCMLHILLELSTTYPVFPCTVPEATGSIAKLFAGNHLIETAAYRLSALYNLIIPSGKLKADFNPDDLIKTIGCGMLLVESLKASIPRSQLLTECEYSLIHLLHCIEDPKSDPKSLDFVNTPTFSRCDDDEDMTEPKSTYEKKPSEILAYLKKHFAEWKAYEGEFIEEDIPKQNTRFSTNVIRTVGRHLNLVKFNSFNELNLSSNPQNDSELIKINKSTSENKSRQDTDLTVSNTDSLMKYPDPDSKVNLSKHNNESFVTKIRDPTCPSEFRNVKIVDNYCKAKSKSEQKFYELKENVKASTPRKEFNENSKFGIPDGVSEIFTDFVHEKELNNSVTLNNKMAVNVEAMTSDMSSDDNGLGKENCPEHTIVKSFLIELSSSLNIIYKFINESIGTIKGKGLEEENKRVIHDKTDKTYKFLLVIVDRLKRIIEREPDGDVTTVKTLLIKTGADVANDKRVSRYKQLVIKCLEQANLLKNGLKLLLNVTNNNLDSQSIVSTLDHSEVCNFNIFE